MPWASVREGREACRSGPVPARFGLHAIRRDPVVTPKKEEPNTHVTNQFRTRGVMVYDLASEGAQVTISIAPCADNLDGTGDWRAEAFARQAPERPTLAETGATRGDALDAVARAWAAKDRAFGFPKLDWDAIAFALRAVRAV